MSTLKAKYTASASPSQALPSSLLPALRTTTATTTARVAYLTQLQINLRALQADINALLTKQMAHDKAADDARDEETYGEEQIDEEGL